MTERLVRHGLRLAQATITYNVLEGVVAVSAGVTAGLVSLVGFGLDSAIESVSAAIVAVRLSARLRDGRADAAKERRALRAVAITFFVLAGYLALTGTRDLLSGDVPDSSPAGVAILVLSLIVMPWLAWAKFRVGHALGGDRLILADAAETRICVVLSASTLLALILFAYTGAEWLDPVAGYVIAIVAVREGIEAWRGELVEADLDDEDRANSD